jgi:hypothetical protein
MDARIHTHPGVAFAVRGGVSVLLWTGDPTLAANQWAVERLLGQEWSRSGPRTGVPAAGADGSGLPREPMKLLGQEWSRSGPRTGVPAAGADGSGLPREPMKLLGQRGVISNEMVLLQIITEGAGTPDAEARRYIQSAYQRELSDMQRVVTAPLGDSFRQSVIRTIMRGMAVFARKSEFVTIVSTLDAGIAAVTKGRASPTPRELDACIDAMFAALGVARPAETRAPSAG